MYILITLEVKNENIPKLFSQYILKRSEWEPIKKYLKNDIELIIDNEELSNEKIFVNKNTLKITEDFNEKHIEAFKILYRNSFFNFDLLDFFKNYINKPAESPLLFDMDENDSDIGYYLKTKKNTPEFSSLDDEKIKKFIIETKKTVNLFKNNKNE